MSVEVFKIETGSYVGAILGYIPFFAIGALFGLGAINQHEPLLGLMSLLCFSVGTIQFWQHDKLRRELKNHAPIHQTGAARNGSWRTVRLESKFVKMERDFEFDLVSKESVIRFAIPEVGRLKSFQNFVKAIEHSEPNVQVWYIEPRPAVITLLRVAMD